MMRRYWFDRILTPAEHSRAEASTSINFSQRRRRHALFELPDVRRRLRIACPATG
jgi:hypothetical protein